MRLTIHSTASKRSARHPAKQGDYAYLLHIVRSLKSAGKGACIMPHGVLFRGNAEAEIRRNLVPQRLHQRNHGTAGQPVLWHRHPRLSRRHRQGGSTRSKGHFHDRRKPGLYEGRTKEPPTRPGIHKIVDAFDRPLEVPKYARMVTLERSKRTSSTSTFPATSTASRPKTSRTSRVT